MRLARLALALGLLGGCQQAEPAPPPRAALVLEPRVDQRIDPAPGPGPARAVRITVRIKPMDGLPLEVQSAGVGESSPLLELKVRWEDYSGDGPVVRGRSTQVLVPWTGLGTASPEAPVEASCSVDLSATDGVLARRVLVEGRIIGVDLVRPEGHSGGRLLAVPRAELASLAPAPPGLLEEHLQSGQADGIFLAAAGAPPEWRQLVLDRLIEALPASRGPAREAIFASLLWLTGQTLGRDVQRWSSWWSEERRKAGH